MPDGLARAQICCWARWAWIFIIKITDMSSYNVNTPVVLFYLCLGGQEWMDGGLWVWMTLILMISSIISDLINTYIANNLEPTWVHVSVYGTNY